MEVFAVRPEIRSRFYVSVDAASWSSLRTNRLLLVPTPPVFSYYSNLFLDGAYSRLVLNIARSEFAVCTLMQFLWVAASGLTDTFAVDSRLRVGQTYLIALDAPMIALIEGVGVKNIFLDSSFDMVTALRARSVMTSIDWAKVSSVPDACLLPYDFRSGTVSHHTDEGTAREVRNGRDSRISQPFLTAVPYLSPPPS